MRSDIPASFNSQVRQIKARAVAAVDRSEWRAVEVTPIPAGVSASSVLNTAEVVKKVRTLVLAGNNLTQYITNISPLKIAWREVSSDPPVPASIPGGAPSDEYRAIAVQDKDVYCAVNGKIYQLNAAAQTWEQIWDLTDPVTHVVPKINLHVTSNKGILIAATYSGASVQDHCKLSVLVKKDTNYWVLDTWNGLLPKVSGKLGITGVFHKNYYYIYVDDWSGKKPIQIKRYALERWSATREILPLDALDDESSFKVGCASVIKGKVVLTGTLKRKFGPAYSIFMVGPDQWTFGRDLIIEPGFDRPFSLIELFNSVWALDREKIYTSSIPLLSNPSTVPLQSNSQETSPFSFTLDRAVNQPDRLTMEVPARHRNGDGYNYDDGPPSHMIPGAKVDLIVSSDGNSEVKVGQYGVDRVRKMEREDGVTYSIDCSSYNMKKLENWESDTYFDYMSQGEAHGDPGDLTRVVRASGGSYKSVDGGGLRLESLNSDGMLYTVVPASHGGLMRCKFTGVQSKHTMVGVGTNYGEETLAEAAARLKKKVENVKADERGRWAVFAIYNPNPYGGPAGKAAVYLVDWNTNRRGSGADPDVPNPYRIIASAYVDRPAAPATIWLAIQFQDGFARVFYTGSDSADMSLVIAAEAQAERDLHPTEHENYGRGCLFIRNNTGFHMTYPVTSDSDVVPIYSTAEKNDRFGIPLEDRTDNFPAANGVIKIDSEQILYAGLAGWPDRRVTADLQYVPGKVVARSCDGYSTPTGNGWMDFANSRGTRGVTPHGHGNNYIMQNITPAAGSHLTAVRVWLKKVNFPEDGLTLTIHAGNVSSSDASWRLVSSSALAYSSVSSSQIKPDGGWVTFFLDRDVVINQSVYNAGSQYWIILKRTKNHTHPSSASYFSVCRMPDSAYAGGGCYVFCEEDDQSIGQGGDMAFAVYARVDDANKEYMFPVMYQGGVGLRSEGAASYWSGGVKTSLQDWWNGCAITITKGAGVNNCYRIVRSFRLQDSMNDLMVFALDRDPGKIFGTDTQARAVPAFYGLKRGHNGTTAAAHGGKSQAHVPWSQFSIASYFEYYTSDEDLTLAEVAEAIARKAGVVNVVIANRHSGLVANNGPIEKVPAFSKNCIILLELPTMAYSGDFADVYFSNADDTLHMGVMFYYETLTDGSKLSRFEIYKRENVLGGYTTQLFSYRLNEYLEGQYRVSLYDGHISVWIGGRLLGAANLLDHLFPWSDVQVRFSAADSSTAPVLIPEAGTRVESFVMDMGKSGLSLLQTLVGEKRIFYRDLPDGSFKIFTEREAVPAVYTRAVARTLETTDAGLATRVLLEGGEVVEVSSDGNIQKYGNFFKSFNINEINNLDDAAYFAEIILEDMTLNRERVSIEGAVDLAVEPTDEITVEAEPGLLRQVVVDGVTHSMHIDEIEAVYDMRLTGRYRPLE